MARSSTNSMPTKTRTLSELSPGDVVLYLGAKWKVTGIIPPYANMIGRELRCIEGKGTGVVAKIHEADEISAKYEVVEGLAA